MPKPTPTLSLATRLARPLLGWRRNPTLEIPREIWIRRACCAGPFSQNSARLLNYLELASPFIVPLS